MARRKKRSTRCKVVTVNGRRRKLCWGSNGRLTSNRPSSGRKTTKRRKTSKRKKTACKFGCVKSGARKGLCRKGRRKATKKSSRTRKCKFGVNKNNGRCLKRRRSK